jgi:hypothetical protein
MEIIQYRTINRQVDRVFQNACLKVGEAGTEGLALVEQGCVFSYGGRARL